MIYTRAIHFAATLAAAGVVFFFVVIAMPALRTDAAARLPAVFRARLAAIAWSSLVVTLLSGAAWFVLTAQSMSGQTLADALSQDVLGTVLLQTDFGNDWLVRLVLLVVLTAFFVPLLAMQRRAPRWLEVVALAAAAALAGSLAWSGHAIGANGVEGIVHPTADVLHLVAAAAWLGTLPLLVLWFAAAESDEISVAAARTATSRFSTLGIVSVGTLLATGAVNTWYLAGSIDALADTLYGRLLLAKIALFFAMVAVAAVNRLRLTPLFFEDATAAPALRQLRRNATIETLLGALVIVIVAVLGTEPPGSHAQHHAQYGAVPAGAAFTHIHTEQGMADVTIMPGHIGKVRATVRLWDDDSNALDARDVTVALAPPQAGAPIKRVAVENADGAWEAGDFNLPKAGNWTITVNAQLGASQRLILEAPIVIDARP